MANGLSKTEIINMALRFHGKNTSYTQMASNNPPIEVEYAKTFYDAAVLHALGEADWSFFTTPIEIDFNDDAPQRSWAHGYRVCSDILRLVPMRWFAFEILGDRFYTNEDKPSIWGIKADCFDDSTKAPKDFCLLVANALAYELCSVLCPSDNAKAQTILQFYSWTLSPMLASRAVNSAHSKTIDEMDKEGTADGGYPL